MEGCLHRTVERRNSESSSELVYSDSVNRCRINVLIVLQNFLGGGLILAQAHLAELDLSDNALGPVGMEGLVAFLKSPVCFSLKTLRLNNNGLGIYGGRVSEHEMCFIFFYYT